MPPVGLSFESSSASQTAVSAPSSGVRVPMPLVGGHEDESNAGEHKDKKRWPSAESAHNWQQHGCNVRYNAWKEHQPQQPLQQLQRLWTRQRQQQNSERSSNKSGG